MNKTKTFVVAVAVPAALLAMAAQSVSAATAPTTTVASGATVPAGYVRLVDDTNHITVTVPNTWSTVQTVPGQSPTGTDVASILATAGTGLDDFTRTFVDGVWYAAYPYSPDPSVLMNQNKLPAGLCVDITDASDNVQPYSDGLFTGLMQVGTSCGSGAATWNLIVASPPDQSFTAVVEVQTTDPQALQTVHDSFNYLAGAGPVGTTIPGAATTVAGGVATTAVTTPVITPPVQTTTVTQPVATTVTPSIVVPTTSGGPTSSVALTDATLPLGPLQPTDVALRDDTDEIQIAVPAEWTATNTAPLTNADGTQVPFIAASTDLAALIPPRDAPNTFSVPGVVYWAEPFTADTMAVLNSLGMGTSCTDGGIAPYGDAAFTGFFQTWTNCGGGATEVISLAASARDGSATVSLQIQLPTADAAALQTVVSSFNLVDGGPAVTTAN